MWLKRLASVLSSILIYSISIAQSNQSSIWSPQVRIDGSDLPVTGVTIDINSKNYFPSNELGVVPIPLAILKISDTINVRHIGFETKKIIVTNLNELLSVILLKEAAITLNEVKIIENKKKSKTLEYGPNSFSISHYLTAFNRKYALYLPKYENEGYIKEIIINMSNKANGINAPFKISLYKKNNKSEFPSEQLMEGFIVSNKKSEKSFSIDISYLGIKIPDEGVFIVFETLPQEYYSNDILKIHGWQLNKLPSLKYSSFPKKFNKDFYSLIHFGNAGWVKMPNLEFQFQAKILTLND
ncbi:hypothetical protein [Pedobacter montanisoli]|uniref:Carboxypeptidase-like regulatory domain-containing protein n=1 Tax=Pedobacter montanisoli TaxID=2923277 RepID=A0ABS9ZWF3_9SPHI|nr:hypothetical protein [Pedobacter montanisoli]MCJ0742635.1 hypothetical protein [Pedobacter montanisoli]